MLAVAEYLAKLEKRFRVAEAQRDRAVAVCEAFTRWRNMDVETVSAHEHTQLMEALLSAHDVYLAAVKNETEGGG